MNSLYIRDFRYGLDTRRGELTQRPGSLEVLHNGFINQGGEIENRKAFVRTARISGTYGLQSTSSGLVTFGSADLASSHPVNIGTVGTPIYVNYVRLQHPAIAAGESTATAAYIMTELVYSFVYRGLAFAIAKFGDGKNYCYYDGVLASDFVSGLILPYLDQNNVRIAKNITDLIDASGGYGASQVTFTTTKRARVGGVATLTVASTAGLVVGQKIKITGFTGGATVYNNALATIVAPLTSTTVSYNISDTSTETLTNDTSGTITSSLILITSDLSNDFSLSTAAISSAGSFTTPTTTTSAVAAIPGSSAIASFRLAGGRQGGAASAVLVTTTTNVTAGDTVTINGKVYTFVSTLTSTEGNVLRGSVHSDSLQNLADAINHNSLSGTLYSCVEAHPDVEASALNIAGTEFTLVAKIGGTVGNAITVADTSTQYQWKVTSGGANTSVLAGGVDSSTTNTIESIKVISPTGTEVNLLQFAIPFVKNVATTNTALVTAINDYADTSGYTAIVTNGLISIYSKTTLNPQPTDYVLQITAKGNVCVGECFFYFTVPAGAINLTAITVDGVNVLGAAVNYDVTALNASSLTKIYSLIETQINAGTTAGIAHGVVACARAGFLQISKRVTRSDQNAISVYCTFTGTSPAGGGVVFINDPETKITTDVFTASISPKSYTHTYSLTTQIYSLYEQLYPVTCSVIGGTPPYKYQWYVLLTLDPDAWLKAGQVKVPLQSNPGAGVYYTYFNNISGVQVARQPTSQITNMDKIVGLPNSQQIPFVGTIQISQWKCRVTDAAGLYADSDVHTFTHVIGA